jgi:WD40 repeat protein
MFGSIEAGINTLRSQYSITDEIEPIEYKHSEKYVIKENFEIQDFYQFIDQLADNIQISDKKSWLLIHEENNFDVVYSFIIKMLWSKYDNHGSLPLLISLSDLYDPFYNALPEALKQYGFNEVQINELKTRPLILFISNYHKMNAQKNFWVTNKLNNWNVKTIFIFPKSDYSSQLDALFIPFHFERKKSYYFVKLWLSNSKKANTLIPTKTHTPKRIQEVILSVNEVPKSIIPLVIDQNNTILKDIQSNCRLLTQDTSTLQFLADRVNQDDLFKQKLFFDIDKSKTNKDYATLSANAISILNRAQVPLSGLNFDNIQAPYVNLSYGVFDSTSFVNADISYANLQAAWLRNAKLNQANCKGVYFGELAPINLGEFIENCIFLENNVLAIAKGRGDIHITNILTHEIIKDLSWYTSKSRAVFSPNGMLIATACYNRLVSLWHADTRAIIHIFRGHTANVLAVAFNYSSDLLISAGDDKNICVFDIHQKSLVKTLKGHTDSITCIAVHPTRNIIASGSKDSTLKLWDIGKGTQIFDFKNHTDVVWNVVFDPLGKKFVSISWDNTAKIYDVDTGELLNNIALPAAGVDASFDHTGRLLVTCDATPALCIWESDSGVLLNKYEVEKYIRSCSFYPNSDKVILSIGTSIYSYDYLDQETQFLFGGFDHGHSAFINSLAFSPNGSLLLSGSYDHSIKLWNMDFGNLIQNLVEPRHITNLTYKNQRLAVGCSDGIVRIWNYPQLELVYSLVGHDSAVNTVIFDNTNKLYSASNDNTIAEWDLDSGSIVHNYLGHTKRVTSLAYTDSLHLLISGSEDQTILLWDTVSKQSVKLYKFSDYFSTQIKFDEKLNLIIATNGNNLRGNAWFKRPIIIWDAITKHELATLNGHIGGVDAVAISPNHDLLATAGDDHIIRLWDLKTYSLYYKLHGHSSKVLSLCFNDDGTILVSGGWDKCIRFWQIHSNMSLNIGVDNSHIQEVQDLIVILDEQFLLSVSNDCTLKIWDLVTGKLYSSLEHTYPGRDEKYYPVAVRSVAYDSWSKLIFSANRLGQIQVWSLGSKSLVHAFSNLASCLSIDPVNHNLASGQEDGAIIIYEAKSYKSIHTVQAYEKEINKVLFSQDGKLFFSCANKYIQVRETKNYSLLHNFNGHTDKVSCVALNSVKNILASVSWDHELMLWDISGNRLSVLPDINDYLFCVTFSPEGRYLAAGGNNHSVWVWEVDNKRKVDEITGFTSTILCLSWVNVSGQSLLFVGDSDGIIRCWQLSKIQNQEQFLLCWTSRQTSLTADLTDITEAKGLSQNNVLLFHALGAIGEPLSNEQAVSQNVTPVSSSLQTYSIFNTTQNQLSDSNNLSVCEEKNTEQRNSIIIKKNSASPI